MVRLIEGLPTNTINNRGNITRLIHCELTLSVVSVRRGLSKAENKR